MSIRQTSIAAVLALMATAATSSLAATSASPVYTPPPPTQVQSICFWRAWVGHWSPLFKRPCEPGEKPFSVKEYIPG